MELGMKHPHPLQKYQSILTEYPPDTPIKHQDWCLCSSSDINQVV